MANTSTASVDTVIDLLREKNEISLVDIVSLAEVSVDHLRSSLEEIDSSIYTEFRAIAEQIATTKAEIGQLSASDIQQDRIPEAGRELHAVVEATEEATNKIMECAETIMTADPSDHAVYHTIVNDNIMAIFEACSFQDLTGQRISKVVETLEIIDKRVTKFSNAVGNENRDNVRAELDQEDLAREQRKKDLILNGPAVGGPEVCQDAIDNMFD